MSKKSILYIITKSVWGGAAKYVLDLAIGLNSKYNIKVAGGPSYAKATAGKGKGKLAQETIKANIPYFEIKNFQKKVSFFKDIFAFFEILKLIFKLKPDIIHINSSKAGGIAGLAGWIYKKTKNPHIKIIFTAHGWAFAEDKTALQIILVKFFSRLTAFFCDKIICVSEYDRQIAIKNNITKQNKLITIHNGIDAESIKFLPREEAQRKLINKTSPFLIGCIAEWNKNKGIRYLLEASPNFDTVLIGSGENIDKEKVYRIIRKYKLNNIYTHEWIKDVSRYFKAFNLFILPSVKEGLPYTLLEAGLAQVPVIATLVGGVPEIIEHNINGILVQPKNSQELANAITKIIRNKELKLKLTQSSREKIIQNFSLKQMIEKTRKVYLSS